MSYSTSYQTVISGRVREDETSFFGLNKVATPTRVTTFNNLSATKEPVVSVDHLQFTGVGKAGNVADPVTGFVSDNLSAYNPAKNQIS